MFGSLEILSESSYRKLKLPNEEVWFSRCKKTKRQKNYNFKRFVGTSIQRDFTCMFKSPGDRTCIKSRSFFLIKEQDLRF